MGSTLAASAWTDSNVQNVVRRRVVRAEPPEHGRGKAEAGAEMDGALTNDAQAHANDAHCLTRYFEFLVRGNDKNPNL